MFSKLFRKGTSNNLLEADNQKLTDKKQQRNNNVKPTRIGDIGEYKINIQLDLLPKECKYLNDILIPNSKSKSGYSQIDHVVLTSYAIFVIETKNYQGTIYGGKDRKTWSVNGKFNMLNPFHQNFGHISALKSIVPIDNSNVVSMISFTKRCTFKVDLELRQIQSNDLIVYDIELSEFISRKLNVLKLKNGSPAYSEFQLEQIYEQLNQANITDKETRRLHVQTLKSSTSNTSSLKPPKASNATPASATCKVCGTAVTAKVKDYCLLNKKRFNGDIYCYEHQKTV
ncbi:MAG TPA: nuclease-related domain-containing protein [Metabacillus sp.]|nr:nuclease-related domain-containing protein [Metabacillus sp.]